MTDLTEQGLRDWMRSRLTASVHDTEGGEMTRASAVAHADRMMAAYLTHARPRFIVGAYRYDAKRAKGVTFDQVGSAIKRLQRYQREGNQEDLVDAANLCAVELVHPTHPNPVFVSTDDGEHVEEMT